MACVANWGLQSRTDQWAYRPTLMIQFIIPIVLIAGGFFLPESPRWLIGRGKVEEARRVLHFLRRGTPVALIDEELNLLVQAEEQDRELYLHTSWADVFMGPNLRRTLISAGVQCLQQAQGSGFIVAYSVVFLQTIGVTNSFEILIYLYMVNCLSSVLAFHFVDRIGRRPLMIGGAILLSLCMFVLAGLTGFHGSDPGAQKGALACLFIWQFVQAISWASWCVNPVFFYLNTNTNFLSNKIADHEISIYSVWIVCAEVPTLAVREKTVTVATFSGFSTSVLITFVSPFIQDTGYGNLQGKIAFVWGAGSIIAATWAFFVLPELKGRTLEELDELFQKRVNVFEFGRYQTTGAGATLAVIEGMAHTVDDKTAELVVQEKGLDRKEGSM